MSTPHNTAEKGDIAKIEYKKGQYSLSIAKE